MEKRQRTRREQASPRSAGRRLRPAKRLGVEPPKLGDLIDGDLPADELERLARVDALVRLAIARARGPDEPRSLLPRARSRKLAGRFGRLIRQLARSQSPAVKRPSSARARSESDRPMRTGGEQECRDYGWSGPKVVAGGAGTHVLAEFVSLFPTASSRPLSTMSRDGFGLVYVRTSE
jgi:hypothetical protein